MCCGRCYVVNVTNSVTLLPYELRFYFEHKNKAPTATLKPEVFACLLFRDLNKFVKITGRKY